MDLWAAHLTARSAVRLSVTRFLHNWRMFQFSFSILQSSFEVLGFNFENMCYSWEYLDELWKHINSLNLQQYASCTIEECFSFRFQCCNPLSNFSDSILKICITLLLRVFCIWLKHTKSLNLHQCMLLVQLKNFSGFIFNIAILFWSFGI